jgi:NitT/TauT family transport system substrate-binding protein
MNKQHPKPYLHQIIVRIVCLALFLAACTPQPMPSTPAAVTPEPVHLKVGTLPYISNTIIKIAAEEGFFIEQGLAVELVDLKSSNDFFPLLLKGELDVATPALTPGFFNAVAKGGNLKIVLPLTDFKVQDCASSAFLARKADVEAKVYADMAHWKGARVALTSGGGPNSAAYVLAQALRQGSLGVSDIQIETIDLAVQAEALRASQVDIVFAVEPWVTRMLAQGDIAVLFPGEPLAPELTSSVIVFGARPLANPDIGNRFATAYLKAVRQYLQGKTPRNIELVAAYTSLDPELVKQVCWSHSPPDGQINVDSIMAYQTWLKESGALDRVLEPKEFLDTSFAEAANHALGNNTP